MATIAGEPPYQERSVFVRKATGLVRGWSVHDAFIYAAFSINLITLGLYIFSFGPFIPKGSLLLAVILSGPSSWFRPTAKPRRSPGCRPRAGASAGWTPGSGGASAFLLPVGGWGFLTCNRCPL